MGIARSVSRTWSEASRVISSGTSIAEIEGVHDQIQGAALCTDDQRCRNSTGHELLFAFIEQNLERYGQKRYQGDTGNQRALF